MAILQLLLLIIILAILLSRGPINNTKQSPKSNPKTHGRLILDSCGLIDGRIVDLVRIGFVTQELVVPQFILSELQLLADGQDAHKRERARFGLDIAQELQKSSGEVVVTIDHTTFDNLHTNDDKLIALAKKSSATLYTNDYNLGKVATLEGVNVLNINELAHNLRPVSLPGETLTIKILQRGSSSDQGVGYLDDGTMIVVDNASRSIGKKLEVIVDRMHQTVAGKMVFAHPAVAQMNHPAHKSSKPDNIRERMYKPKGHQVAKTNR
ncbi:MAG TPA: TRAM domain-containing protein [Candidatus Saccharimonadales bacterium]|jgi:uncharacterized protein YacL|nr:TRAM domain-containing protein [Candidatus Saccharimonadales bacterium]